MAKSKSWKKSSGIIVIVILLIAWNLVERDNGEPYAGIDLWVNSEEKDAIDSMSAQLRDFIVSEVDFQDRPFYECMNELEEICNRHLSGADPFRFRFAEGIDMDSPITASLANVPIIEAIRYTARKNDCYYRWIGEGVLDIAPRSLQSKRGEGIFKVGNHVFPAAQGLGPIDVKKEFETIGIDFEEGDVADYYPGKRILWASATYNSMDAIGDYCSSMSAFEPPGFFERVRNRVREVFGKMAIFPQSTSMINSLPVPGAMR